ncbi:MAG: DUF4230 domain-containing protein [Verrucomicrobia bacterium]|nr:DUF4230 domain-containing protein [Verrucomicrobiota bacterium]
MRRGRISWPLALVIIVLLVTTLAWYSVHRLSELPGEAIAAVGRESARNAAKVSETLVELFHLRPTVTTRNEIKIDPQTAPISQLALVSRETEVTRQTSTTWLGSTKSVRLRAVYRVQAGFDLMKRFSVEVSGNHVEVKVPPAEILTVEPVETHVDGLDNGLWNRVQASDVQTELAAMPDAARVKAADLPAAAEDAFQKTLRDRLAPAGLQVDVSFEEAKPPVPAPSGGL